MCKYLSSEKFLHYSYFFPFLNKRIHKIIYRNENIWGTKYNYHCCYNDKKKQTKKIMKSISMVIEKTDFCLCNFKK